MTNQDRGNLEKFTSIKNINLVKILNIKKNNLSLLLQKTNTVIFNDDSYCPTTCRLLLFLKNNLFDCEFIFFGNEALPTIKRNILMYIIYPHGVRKNNMLDLIKNVAKIAYLLIFRFPIEFISFPNDKVTFLSPDYGILPNLKVIKVIPTYKKFNPINKNFFSRIVYLYGKDIAILGNKGFENILEILKLILKINSKNTIFLKLHPNHKNMDCLSEFKKGFNGFNYKLIENETEFSDDLIIGSTTSAIYNYKCLSAINLYNLVEKHEKFLINNVNFKSYFCSNDEYFNYPKHIYHPKSISELKNYFTN
tara:strand:+ start:1994 stop:2917 length:924 start_codon:yes stop_codon:yes gene_type:complete